VAETVVPRSEARRGLLARLPLWVRISAAIALVLVAVFAASMVLGAVGIGGDGGGGHGGGSHGSGRQTQMTDRGGGDGHVPGTDHGSERSPGPARDHGPGGSGDSHDSVPGD
jgi:hypothetical protein